MPKRRRFTASQKAAIVLEVLKEEKTIAKIASENSIHPNLHRKAKAMNSIEEITELLEEEDTRDIIFAIGVALQYEYAPAGRKYSAPYQKMGKELWLAVQYDLHRIICDPKSNELRFFIDELVSGDIRDLATAVLTVIISQLSIPLAIATPIVAMILKLGLRKFCRLRPKRPKLSYLEILSRQKNEMRKMESWLHKAQKTRTRTPTK